MRGVIAYTGPGRTDEDLRATVLKVIVVAVIVIVVWANWDKITGAAPADPRTGCPAAFATSTTAATGHHQQASDELVALRIADVDNTAPYDRDQWMPGGKWRSEGHGHTTRTAILERDRCADGTWVSPYDAQRITDASKVDIDHVVPLAEATRSGAAGWTAKQRNDFANSPANLIAVSQHTNRSKGDDDPSTWQPEQQSVLCGYAEQYIGVKYANHLAVDSAERTALITLLRNCKDAP